MSSRDDHPAAGGLCLWDTCSGCGDNGRFDRGYDPSHLCVECDEAMTLLRDAQVANVTELRPAPDRWFRRARRSKAQ